MKPIYLLAGIALLLLAGCEGYECRTGFVKDKTTGLSLDSVQCTVISGSQQQLTDSSGAYTLCNDFGGCFGKCKAIVIRFSRNGYQPAEVSDPGAGAVIYLEK